MKYLQNGGFQSNPFMRMTLAWTLVFAAGLWVTNAAMYFQRMNLTPKSVRAYYLGDDSEYTQPKSAAAMLEVSHAHLATMGVMVLLLTHLAIFMPWEDRTKKLVIAAGFGSSLFGEASGWLVRFVSPAFAPLKIVCFAGFQLVLAVLIVGLAGFLYEAAREAPRRKKSSREDPLS